ncbi:MAG: hypothetical protein LBO00_05575 [Zoogloeaceae bacterium]|nr:hypothetical protein [Zoogloeaceae bacterium]
MKKAKSRTWRRRIEARNTYFDKSVAKSIIGKHLLVGVTRKNHQGEVVSLEQFHGEIIRASQEEGIVIRLAGSADEWSMPPDLSNLEPAPPGNYRLKASGEVVVNPDFLSTWAVTMPTTAKP